jgi:hypothetical protein
VVPEAIGNEARRSSDEAVRRLREESRRRIEQRGRWRAFSSWCALATLAAGISLAALSAQEVRQQEREARAAAAPTAERDRSEQCTRLRALHDEIESEMYTRLLAAPDQKHYASVEEEALVRLAALAREWKQRACPAVSADLERDRLGE